MLKRYKKTIIVAILLWIPLALIIYHHSSDQTIKKILMSVLSGPIVFFSSGILALIVGAVMTGSAYITRNLEVFKNDKEENLGDTMTHCFNASFGIVFAVVYYCAITNQHIFLKFYGGW